MTLFLEKSSTNLGKQKLANRPVPTHLSPFLHPPGVLTGPGTIHLGGAEAGAHSPLSEAVPSTALIFLVSFCFQNQDLLIDFCLETF